MTDSDSHEERTGESGPESRPIPEAFRLSTYHYDLPRELIAQRPAAVRDESRLLVLDRETAAVDHRTFRDLPSLLHPSDLLVVNETKVTPARLLGRKPSGGLVELLVLDPVSEPANAVPTAEAVRACMIRSAKRTRSGTEIQLRNGSPALVVEEIAPGRVLVRFPVPETGLLEFLEKYGEPPLPPYIDRPHGNTPADRKRYQTIYARVAGSIAAPTAGLHFTERLLADLATGGIEIARITLHVGAGTFRPVRDDDIRLHEMEWEAYDISPSVAERLNRAVCLGRRIVAVGTTAVRTLESAVSEGGSFRAGSGKTNLFIYPGYSFKSIHGIITNFHLPSSTLLMVVCAFAGVEFTLGAYREAIQRGYRFYSYGDACLII